MAVLNPTTATRVLDIPEGSEFTTLPFGDTFLAGWNQEPQPLETTEYGFPAIRRQTAEPPYPSPLTTDTDLVAPAAWTLMIALDSVDEMTTVNVFTGSLVTLVADATSSPVANAGETMIVSGTPVDFSPPLDGKPVVFVISGSDVDDCYFANDRQGILATAPPMASPAQDGPLGIDNSSYHRVLGMWLWEDGALSQQDAVDTAQAIAAMLSDDTTPVAAASTVGPAYAATVAQSILGPYRAPGFPDTMWGGWLDSDGNLLAMTGVEVPHSAFSPTASGVTNIAAIDAGLMPAGGPTRFGLFDAESGGDLIIYCEASFDETPAEGTPVSAVPGALHYVVTSDAVVED